MRNGQLKPGYNVQIGVNSEYITGIEVFSDRNDVKTLCPMLRRMERFHQARYEEVTAAPGMRVWTTICTWIPWGKLASLNLLTMISDSDAS